MQQVAIATSIAPSNIELQQTALKSWHTLGFRTVSVNSEPEIEILRDHFPWVKFVIAHRTAKALAGKPLVFFDDVLKALEQEDVQICGIVNSDIHLREDQNYLAFISQAASGSLVFARRLEVSSLDFIRPDAYYYWGFDVFFFDRSIIPLYPPSIFCIGAPWWDYWAPLVASLKSYPTKHLISPTAIHLTHETKWSEELYVKFGQRLMSEIGMNLAHPEGSGKLFPSLASVVVMLQILSSAQVCTYPAGPCPTQDAGIKNLQTTQQLREVLHGLERNASASLGALLECDRMRSSLSWRLTQPVRLLKKLLSEAYKRWPH